MTKIRIAVVASAVLILAWIALQGPNDAPSAPSSPSGMAMTQAGARRESGPAAAEPVRRAAVERNESGADVSADVVTGGAPVPPPSHRPRHRIPPLQSDSNVTRQLAHEFPPTAAVAPPLPESRPSDVLYDSGDEAQFRSDDQIELDRPGRIDGVAGTIAFDLKPQWEEPVGNADFITLGDSAKVAKLGDLLQFEVVDAGDVRHVVTTKVDQWEPGASQRIVATWDDRQLYLYVNGELVSTDAIEHPIQIAADAPMRIGSSYDDGRPVAAATISRIRLRDELFVPTAGETTTP